MATSHPETALTHTMSAVAIASRAAWFSRRSSRCHHRTTCVSSSSFIRGLARLLGTSVAAGKAAQQTLRQRRVEIGGDPNLALRAAWLAARSVADWDQLRARASVLR